MQAQDFLRYRKNYIGINATQLVINEINIGYERFYSQRRSIEINGGLIYQNSFLIKNTSNWDNSLYFYERGFAVRVAQKFYKKQKENSSWKEYFAAVLSYEYLYIPNSWFETTIHDSAGYIYLHRFRSRIGGEFLLGWMRDLNKSFSVELYAGVGVRYIIATRTDLAQSYIQDDPSPYYINIQTSQSYFRPSVHAGVKLRAGW
jgi:hypothetical protein